MLAIFEEKTTTNKLNTFIFFNFYFFYYELKLVEKYLFKKLISYYIYIKAIKK